MIQRCSLGRAALIRGLMSDVEWAFFAPFLIENRSHGGRLPQDHRKVLDGIFWITRTGSPWRDLPDEFGNWNSVHRQYRRWTEAGVWDVMLAALAESEVADTTMQMIDSTIVRAHQHAAGGKGGFIKMLSAVRAVGSRPNFIPERMRRVLPSASA
jgi:transposase